MGLEQPGDQRFFTRYLAVNSGFDGQLVTEEDARVLEGRVLDVCRDGIGVLLHESVGVGSTICLDFKERRIAFRVVYCQPDLVHRGLFRCGLNRRGPGENLIALFKALDVLAER